MEIPAMMNTLPTFLLLTLGMAVMLMACSSGEQPVPDSETGKNDVRPLKEQIEKTLEPVEGRFAVAFIDVQDPDHHLFIRADEWFHAASTMKTPVLIEAHRQQLEGRINLDDLIPVKNEFISIADGSTYSIRIDRDSGDDLYEHLGSRMSMRELCYSMIVRSGNLATNLVIEFLGADNVNSTMAKMGAEGIRVLRGVEDMPAFNAGMNNETTARGLAVMFLRLARGEILNEEARNEILSVLKDQHFREMIPARLPDGVVVAHKTGSISGITHDSGIVYLPDGRSYVLVILARDLPEHRIGREAGAEISRLIYEYMTDDKKDRS